MYRSFTRRMVRALLALVVGANLLRLTTAVAADESRPPSVQDAKGEQFAIHGQFTFVEQETSSFKAPYSGPNSLSPGIGRESVDASLYLGGRLWPGAEAWINSDVDQGFGLNNTLGVAGFPSGAAYKVGKNQPYLRLPRLFLRQTVNLDDVREAIDAGPLQLGGYQSPNRVVFTVGKFGVTDVFDANQYAHDPRGDFMNWGAIDAGTFDYAADAWGYTVGAAIEWYQDTWTLRTGMFDLSDVPNSEHLEPAAHEFQLILELEKRHEFRGQPGKVLVTAFDSRGRMGLLDDAVRLAATSGGPVDIAVVRRFRSRVGVNLNVEQQVAAELGVFARVGGAGGNVETYEFTDIDRTVAAGLSLEGSRWNRASDTVGLAAIVNEISPSRRRFLNAGGLGVLVGDGRLPHAGPEQIVETYYQLTAFSHAHLALDYQWVNHPAYNTDRGPVSIVSVRMHAQF
jgi:high affinity Mn2+ porin